MTCHGIQDKLLMYLAGELHPADAERLVKHLEKCSRCTAQAEVLAGARDAAGNLIRTSAVPPESLDSRILSAVRALPEPRRSMWHLSLPSSGWRRHFILAASAAALALLGFLGGIAYVPSGAGSPAGHTIPVADLSILAADHTRVASGQEPLHYRGLDGAQIAERLTPVLRFKATVPDLSPMGVRIAGARSCRVQGVDAAYVLYRAGQTSISVFEMDRNRIRLPAIGDAPAGPPCYLVQERDGVTFVLWCTERSSFAMVARAEPDRLLRLAGHFAKQGG